MITHTQIQGTGCPTPSARWPRWLGALFVLSLATVLGACRPSPPPQVQPEGEEKPSAEPEAHERDAPERPTPSAIQDGPTSEGRTRAPEAAAEEPAAPPAERHAALLDPSRAREQAPERYTVRLDTTKGEILIDVRRSWAPLGADRFYNLVKIGYFDDTAFFRVISGFMAQIGIHGDPEVNRAWRTQRIEDDPVAHSNARGTVSFATSGKNSRVNQIFINLVDNARLDDMGFAPIGRVRGLEVVEKLHAGYGEGAPAGQGPLQARIQNEGNAYLKASFPALDYIRSARVVDEKTGR